MFHEPGGAADLTRCALLITNIYQPQLDHRCGSLLAIFDSPLTVVSNIRGTEAETVLPACQVGHRGQKVCDTAACTL
jgi:hypothetical protein